MLNQVLQYDPAPYLGIADETGRKISELLVVRRRPKALWWDIIADKYSGKIIGISSNRDFPANDAAIVERASDWLHCFREPERIFPPDLPLALISRSDFCDPTIIKFSREKNLMLHTVVNTDSKKQKILKCFLVYCPGCRG